MQASWRRLHTACVNFLCSTSRRRFSTALRPGWQVSSSGRVCSTRGEVSYGTLRPDGYRIVRIKKQMCLVHRLVARAFLGSPPSKLHSQVNHIDCNKSNNRLQNLEYVTPRENLTHSYASGRVAYSRPVLWRRAGDVEWVACRSQSQVASELGVHNSAVSKCCRQGFGQACGFEFKFADLSADVSTSAAAAPGENWIRACHPKTGCTIPTMFVSTWGRISKSNGRTSYGTLKASGYYVTHGEAGYFYVHRLVAAAFLGLPSLPHLQVNHIDGNSGNNHLANLEYVTPSENIAKAHARLSGAIRGRTGGGISVYGRKTDDKTWVLFSSKAQAARAANVSRGLVTWACREAIVLQNGWSFKLAEVESIPDEEWREVILP